MAQADPSILALITARGGSKGVPGKNIALVAGRPLIAWTIEAARMSRHIGRVVVDTDDAVIAEVARACEAETPYVRPAELARDDTLSMDVVVHALRWLAEHEAYRPDWLCLLQPTSPLRTAADIDAAIELAIARNADAVVSVAPSDQHPLWQKRLDHDGRMHDYVEREARPLQRQGLPPAYVLNGAIYLAKSDILLTKRNWYTGRAYAYVMPSERSLDVDSHWDLRLADLMLRTEGEV
jgi:CMP-N,N'-diacetyllegionaminic acid synthase